MRERTELLIRGMTENRTKRHRWLAMVTALAFLTGGNVFWSLREIGTAVTEETLCTREAHEHSEECYDENGYLICGKEEHVHTAACFSDENADVETAEIWEATLPELDGISRQEQVALIAESQLGYAESVNNFIRSEDGAQHGYSRYGAWYGNPYGEWNTMFAYFCLYYAGVSAEEIPCGGNARTWQVKLTENELIRPPDTEPERGEIVLLDLDADGEADLTGIVTDAAEMLHFVEGNLGHAVAEGELALDAEQILGYVAIPEPDTPDAENPEASPPDESPPEDADESSPDAESAPTEEQPAASESEQPLVTYKAESASGIQVSAVTAEGVFPSGTVMTVEDVAREDALQAAAEGLSGDTETLDAVAVDISFLAADGTELEPTGNVDVQITLPETQQLAGEDFTLLHVQDDGAIETLDAEINGESAVFTAEGFSVFVFVAGQPKPLDSLVMVNGQPGGNSESNPYVVHVGDTIDVFMTDSDQSWIAVDGNNETGGKKILQNINDGEDTSITYNGKTYNGKRKQYVVLQTKPDGVASISRKNDVIYLDIQDYYFVKKNGEYKPASQVVMSNGELGGNSADNPYIVYVGETIDMFLSDSNANKTRFYLSGMNDLPDGKKVLRSLAQDNDNASITSIGYGFDGISRSFKAETPGLVYCNRGNQDFYIKVIDPEIYVKTLYEDKPIDRVKEHLKNYNLQNVEGYVPNGVGQENGVATPRPYVVRQGDEFEIHIPGDADYAVNNYDLNFDASYNYVLTPSEEQKIQLISKSYEDGMTILRFRGNAVSVNSEVEINFPRLNRSMWVRVFTNYENFTHADMEIADGGTYTVTSVEYENGQPYTVVRLYDAQIVKVNDAWIMGDAPSRVLSHFEADDYESLNEEGSTQYELTSAFKCQGKSEKHYNANDARSAIFNVNVELKPTAIYRLDVSGNSQLIRQYTREESNTNAEIHESIRFDLGQQEIIDAMNKCPMTNGLDFTIRANAAVVKLQAIKNLNGGLLADDQFTFELVDETGNVVSTATNNQKGEVVFLDQVYTEPGTYKYTIREAAEGRDPKMLYDESAQEITVTVREVEGPNETSFLMAEIAGQPEFTNYVTYRLPDTGGVGNLPYYLGGTAILAAASLLMIKKRREGR